MRILSHHFHITSGRDNDLEFLTEGNKDPEPDVDAAYQILNSEPVVYGDTYRRFAQKDRIGLDFPDIFEVSRNEISFSGDGSKITLQRYFKNDWMLVFSDLPSTRGFPAYATLLIANCTHLTKATIDEIIERIFRIQPPKDYNYEEARIISNNSIHEPALSSWEDKEIDR